MDADPSVHRIQLEDQKVFADPQPVVALEFPFEGPDILVPEGVLKRFELPYAVPNP